MFNLSNFITAASGAVLAWNYAQPATSLSAAGIVALGALSAITVFNLGKKACQRHYQQASPSTYQISVNLMCAAQKNNRSDFQTELKAIFKSFSTDLNAGTENILEKLKGNRSFNAWMCGRILLASLKVGDQETVQKILPVLEGLLEEVVLEGLTEKDMGDTLSAHVWGLGYLAIYYAATNNLENFSRIKKLLLEGTDKLATLPGQKNEDNVHWVIVMNLQSLVLANDHVNYKAQLEKLLAFTKTNSVTEALMQIPIKDMRAWSFQLTLSAAKKMKDTALVSELEEALPKALTTSPENDKMLTSTLPSFCDF